EVTIYESWYVTGQNSSVNKDTAPALYDGIRKWAPEDPMLATILRLCGMWNRHLAQQVTHELENNATLTENERKKKEKVVAAIKGHEDFQFVLADFGLAAFFLESFRHTVKAKNLR